jgi:peptide/nickel transport system ATP-binding protein
VHYGGSEITHLKGKARIQLYQKMQMIFQDPFSSLDPRLCTFDLIAEPLRVFKVHKDPAKLDARVRELMATVGISDYMAYAYPHELDGGRRQRIGIARALALNPEFIVCDEPVSALDVSVQAQVLNLLKTLQREKKLTLIFITHDLSVVKHISDDILVMYSGQMAEKTTKKQLFEKPLHPYTKGLLSAIPIPNIQMRKKLHVLKGETTSPINPAPGCRFAPRCDYAKPRCFSEQPAVLEVRSSHFVACHFVCEINGLEAEAEA